MVKGPRQSMTQTSKNLLKKEKLTYCPEIITLEEHDVAQLAKTNKPITKNSVTKN